MAAVLLRAGGVGDTIALYSLRPSPNCMKIFYGWRIVGAGVAIQFMQAAFLHQAFGAYVAVLSEERGWSKTALSGAAALQSIEGAVLGPLLGWIMDRFGPQNVIRIGVVMLGLGFIALSTIDSLMGFYAAILMIALGSALSGYFPLTIATIHWFSRKRARALSALGMGLALGGLAVPMVAWTMQTYGWRATAVGSGLLILFIGLPLATVFRRRPEDYGETVDGLPQVPLVPPVSQGEARGPESPNTVQIAEPVERDFTAKEALRTGAFWFLALGHGFALLVVMAVNVHAISHMKESLQYTVAQASLVIVLMTVSQVGGVGLGLLIGDRYEKRYVAAICMLMHCSGMLMLAYATGPFMLGAFAILHGVGWGLRGPFMQAIRADYFGRRSIGMIVGLSSMFVALGQILGPMIAGVLADMTGDYRLGFTVLALIAGLGSVFFLMAKRPQ